MSRFEGAWWAVVLMCGSEVLSVCMEATRLATQGPQEPAPPSRLSVTHVLSGLGACLACVFLHFLCVTRHLAGAEQHFVGALGGLGALQTDFAFWTPPCGGDAAGHEPRASNTPRPNSIATLSCFYTS
jgi:hypothetical protein